MRREQLYDFAGFQLVWFVSVGGAARGWSLAGPASVALFIALHLRLLPGVERGRELGFIAAVGVLGGVMDSGLRALGLTAYPASLEGVLAPPFIFGLWVAFATIVRHNLAWLRGRPALAALFGALGGPLSYYAGARIGAVSAQAWTWVALALQYGLVVPLLLAVAPRAGGRV